MARRIRGQAARCERVGAPLSAYLLQRSAADIEAGGPCWAVLERGKSTPFGASGAEGLRLLAALHRLVLEEKAPRLAAFFPTASAAPSADDPWPACHETIAANIEALRANAHRRVQTNEVGRSAALLGGFLTVAEEARMPLRILEIGASAGLNLRWDHYRYEIGGESWGDPGAEVVLAPTLRGARLPLDAEAGTAERRGCDLSPLDPNSSEDQLTLMACVWPDHANRIELLRRAFRVAARVPVAVDQADALEWLGWQLSSPTAGSATVVFHSFVARYMPARDRRALRDLLHEAGARATSAAPLAWLRMESGDTEAEITLSSWPGGEERLLARATDYGREITWL